MEIKERIQNLLAIMNQGVYEKETEIGLSLLATLAGESLLLLGPPGVAKSMVARRLKEVFVDASAFEYLMSRFSTPDEIFGPLSIKLLKESDKYERITNGYLPTADVVFLDEIWKAGPAIQNTLLTVINEKLFRNGEKELKLPLKLLVAASNELPTQGEGLEALWDRFLLRIMCTCIQNEDTFYKMLLDDCSKNVGEPNPWQISNEEYMKWQKEIAQIVISAEVLACITAIRKELKKVKIGDAKEHRNVYVSDRRWKNIVRLLKTSAFIHGRVNVCIIDLLPISHCLWNEPDECAEIRQIVICSLFTPIAKKISEIVSSLKSDLKINRIREVLNKAHLEDDHRDDNLQITDHFYYQVENHRTGNTYIFIVDYKKLKKYNVKDIQEGVMYADPSNPERTIIRAFSDPNLKKMQDAECITLYRDDKHIYINGVRFPMKQSKISKEQLFELDNIAVTNRDYETELEHINTEIDKLITKLSENIFAPEEDKKRVVQYAVTIRKEIAWARVDVRKLRYGDEC